MITEQSKAGRNFKMKAATGVLVVSLSLLLLALHPNGALAQAPVTVSTEPATNVSSDSATLNGNLTSLGDYDWALVSFEWGGNATYDNETTPGNVTLPGPFNYNLSGLLPGTTYHFRAKAVGNGTTTVTGDDMTFTALALPSVITESANYITSDAATLNGNLTSLGDYSWALVSFEWGGDATYGNETTPGNVTSPGPFSYNISGLLPDTTYHFRAKAVSNGTATAYGDDMVLTTATVLVLQGWAWCSSCNDVVAASFQGYTTMVERSNAANSYSMHAIGNLTLTGSCNETIELDMYGSRVRSLFYLRQEVTGKSVGLEGTWIPNNIGNETYVGMTGQVFLPNPQGEALKTARICFVVLRTPDVEVPITDTGTFSEDLDSMLTRFVKFVDKTLDNLIGTGFSGILSNILAKIATMLVHIRALGLPYMP